MLESPTLSSTQTISSPKAPSESPASASLTVTDTGIVEIDKVRLMYASFPYFMSEIRDDKGDLLIVDDHHEDWCELMESEQRLCILAPRDHGKTFTSLCYLMWRCWKHNRTPEGELKVGEPDGEFQAVLFSNTIDQAQEFFGKMQVLILANEELFGDIIPTGTRGAKASVKEAWSGGHIRFRNRSDVSVRSFGKSTRGMHPNLIVCDDILSDQNSASQIMRAKVWKYFIGTIDPMLGPDGQLIVIGTAQHYNDLLHRLRLVEGWKWVKYRSVNWDTGRVLWPWRHDLEDLKKKQNTDAVLFAKEFQNDPRDDASSYFPFKLTGPAVEQGANLTMHDMYRALPGEIVVLSADFALSEAIGADYTVVLVAKLDMQTQQRTLLWAARERGWSFQQQVNALRFACKLFDVSLGIIENNSFQRWVRAETEKYPETAGKILGHQTGLEKVSMKDGVPMLTLPLSQKLWTIPSGDKRSKDFSDVWQSEMNAMGYLNDKLQGVGEHDDTVMAFWLLERAVRMVNTLLQHGPSEQYVTMTELGMKPVKIGDSW